MDLYKTTGENSDGDTATVWAGTQADAAKNRKALKSTNFKGVDTEEVDVPTKKADLIAFLNKNAV